MRAAATLLVFSRLQCRACEELVGQKLVLNLSTAFLENLAHVCYYQQIL